MSSTMAAADGEHITLQGRLRAQRMDACLKEIEEERQEDLQGKTLSLKTSMWTWTSIKAS
jgi:hypothetical protein